MKEFKVNKYLTLKLENGETNIYIDEEMFIQCKYLLLQIPIKTISTFDEIESIDKTAEKFKEMFDLS